jgi:hypothetical protein
VVQVAIILLIGLVLGVNIASGVLGVLLIFVLAALFGIAWSGISLFVGLNTKKCRNYSLDWALDDFSTSVSLCCGHAAWASSKLGTASS